MINTNVLGNLKKNFNFYARIQLNLNAAQVQMGKWKFIVIMMQKYCRVPICWFINYIVDQT